MVVPFPARAPRARGRSFAAERVGVATLDLYRCLASRFRRGSAPSADGDARWTVRSRDVHPRGYQLMVSAVTQRESRRRTGRR